MRNPERYSIEHNKTSDTKHGFDRSLQRIFVEVFEVHPERADRHLQSSRHLWMTIALADDSYG